MERLKQAERDHNVKILLAIESGSRAWGFESTNSDYDVRFIYVRDSDWYLDINVENKRDVIEYPIVDEIDINGWDLRKALRLFYKSNPSFVEWINSPLVYMDNLGFAKQVRSMLPVIYSIERGMYHYRSMAKTTYVDHLMADRVKYKKYLYVLRALLSVRYLAQYQEVAPIEFDTLLEKVELPSQLRNEIERLVLKKKSAAEADLTKQLSGIDQYIRAELARLDEGIESIKSMGVGKSDTMPLLNTLFHQVLRDVQATHSFNK